MQVHKTIVCPFLLHRMAIRTPTNLTADIRCVRVPLFCKDGEALRKYSQFDTRAIVLCDRKADKLLTCSSPIVARLNT